VGASDKVTAPRASGAGDWRLPAHCGERRPATVQRVKGSEGLLVALNLGAHPIEADFAKNDVQGEIVLSTKGDRVGETTRNSVAPRDNEGLVIALAPAHWLARCSREPMRRL
jgi:alpha-glucosidase